MKSMTSSENDSCTVTLICTVNGSKDGVQYSWIQKDTHNKTSHESHILRVSPSACDPDLPYTCTARNPVSQNSSQPVRVRQFCTGKWLHSDLLGDSRNIPWGLKLRFRWDIDGREKKENKLLRGQRETGQTSKPWALWHPKEEKKVLRQRSELSLT